MKNDDHGVRIFREPESVTWWHRATIWSIKFIISKKKNIWSTNFSSRGECSMATGGHANALNVLHLRIAVLQLPSTC